MLTLSQKVVAGLIALDAGAGWSVNEEADGRVWIKWDEFTIYPDNHHKYTLEEALQAYESNIE